MTRKEIDKLFVMASFVDIHDLPIDEDKIIKLIITEVEKCKKEAYPKYFVDWYEGLPDSHFENKLQKGELNE